MNQFLLKSVILLFDLLVACRTKKSLENLRKLIKEFSFDAKKDNVIDQIEEIRAKFKLVQTLVGAKQRIVETTVSSLSF